MQNTVSKQSHQNIFSLRDKQHEDALKNVSTHLNHLFVRDLNLLKNSEKMKNIMESQNKQVKNIQISFEKDIIKEHTSVFMTQLPKFIEIYGNLQISEQNFHGFTIQQNIKVHFLKKNISQTEELQATVSSYHAKMNRYQQFVASQPNYQKFLNLSVSTVDQILNKFLFEASFIIWAKLNEFKNSEPKNLEEFIQFSQFISKDIIQANFRASFLLKNNVEVNQKTDHSIELFFKKYCLCIVLVLEGFFQNPLYQDQANYNNCSQALVQIDQEQDDQWIQNMNARKKIKL